MSIIQALQTTRVPNAGNVNPALLIVITLLSLIRAPDEFATSTSGSLQTSIVNEFFVCIQGLDFSADLSQFSLISTAKLPVMI
ncbi:MAG TPA: hypothetical protein VIO61_11145 [Anaerolineaceae bacterium]